MPTVPAPRRRSIGMSEARSRMVANASAYLNISGEQFIQLAISAALMSLADNDKVFSYIIARSGGVDFDDLAKVTA